LRLYQAKQEGGNRIAGMAPVNASVLQQH